MLVLNGIDRFSFSKLDHMSISNDICCFAENFYAHDCIREMGVRQICENGREVFFENARKVFCENVMQMFL